MTDASRTPPTLEATARAASDGGVKSADRVMAVLDLVAERGRMSFSEIMEALTLPKSSAHSLLRTMQRRRYLDLDEATKTYRIGTRVWELAQAAHEIEDLRTLLKPSMDELRDATEETVQLAILDGAEAVYLELSESPHPVKLTSRAGARLPAHSSAIGKSLLSTLDPDEARRRLADAELTRFTSQTIGTVDELMEELERVRRQGYSVDHEEFAIGLRCLAMPIHDRAGEPVAAMSVSIPTPRYDRGVAARARRALGETVARCAELISPRSD
jgi:DNA-binding IclR family transcriptional regulator